MLSLMRHFPYVASFARKLPRLFIGGQPFVCAQVPRPNTFLVRLVFRATGVLFN